MKVIIIGAVAAGMSTAAKLKRNLGDNVQVVVYEKGSEISYGACGLPFYIQGVVLDEQTLYARKPEDFIASGIALHSEHEVLSVNTAAKTVTVKELASGRDFTDSYDKLVVASGATVNQRGVLGVQADNYFSVRKVAESRKIKEMLRQEECETVAVIGAGFIGMEMLEVITSYHKRVILVQRDPHIFTAFDQDFAERMEAIAEKHGVILHKNADLQEMELKDGRITGLRMLVEGKPVRCEVDMVINAAGVIPCTAFISGVEKEPNGAIRVNERMETSIPNVFSAGDCSVMRSSITGRYHYAPLGTNANKQGRIIADVIAGKQPKPFRLIHSSALKLFDHDAAKVGISKREAEKYGMEGVDHFITANSQASYYSDKKIAIKLTYDPLTRRILGAQCIGQGTVVPRANYFAMAIYSGLTVDEMGMMDLAYSPPFNGVWDAALIAANTVK